MTVKKILVQISVLISIHQYIKLFSLFSNKPRTNCLSVAVVSMSDYESTDPSLIPDKGSPNTAPTPVEYLLNLNGFYNFN